MPDHAHGRPLASPLGVSDFTTIRTRGAAYVDKTASTATVLDQPAEVLLFPRPRRFGKTLFLSTLAAWAGRGADRSLFDHLAIADRPAADKHFGRYPIVWLSFKDLKHTDPASARRSLGHLLASAVEHHRPALAALSDGERAILDTLRDGALDSAAIDSAAIESALLLLCRAVHLHTGEKALLLIDEYDTPLHSAWLHGYFDDASTVFRNLLSGGLKDNPHLFKGVLTGILRVAKENLFSGLNNVAVYDLLHEQYATAFGFTDAEVTALADSVDRAHHMPTLREWYDGYRFGGGQGIYNPWSVLSYLGRPIPKPEPYWVATSDDAMIRRHLVGGSLSLADQEALVAGEAIDRPFRTFVSLHEVETRRDAVWGLFLYAGYLTAEHADLSVPEPIARLRAPNREVRTLFQGIYLGWLRDNAGLAISLEGLVAALFGADAETIEAFLEDALVNTFSAHDLPAPRAEAVYHAFVLGLLVHLSGDYDVRSNRESGYGRADVLILPKTPGRPGVVLELKSVRRETPDAALDAALSQIEAKDYAAELRARGADPIIAYGIAFHERRAHVRAVVIA